MRVLMFASMGVTRNNDSNYVKRTRPEIVVNEHCHNALLLRRDCC